MTNSAALPSPRLLIDGDTQNLYDTEQRRIRHLVGVHVRNLTPFPHRDRVTSVLQQPSSLAPRDGHQPDDIDIALSRKRSRRVSSGSVATFRTFRSDDAASDSNDGALAEPSPQSVRKKAHRSTSQTNGLSSSPSLQSPKSRRTRSSSSHSSITSPPRTLPNGSHLLANNIDESPSYLVTSPPSQRSLEKVVNARLVETFLTLSMLEDRTLGVPASPVSPSSPTASKGKTPLKPVAGSGLSSRYRTHSSLSVPTPASNFMPSSSEIVPFYVSSLHRPSTNPSWTSLDAEREFSDWADTKASRVRVTVWGNVTCGDAWTKAPTAKGKEKAVPTDAESLGWRTLVQWDVDLNKAKPLDTHDAAHTDRLPPNTLLFSFYGGGDLYFIPPAETPSHTRPPSPGYASDTEAVLQAGPSREGIVSAENEALRKSQRETKMKKSATWPDMVKIVIQETCIEDTRTSMKEIVTSLDTLITSNIGAVIRRDLGERQEAISTLRHRCETSRIGCQTLQARIAERKTALTTRRKTLGSVRQIEEDDYTAIHSREHEIARSRSKLSDVLSLARTRRLGLLRLVEFIFPIESVSPTDLLFSIVGVPLPVPVNPADPAPPLSVPSQPLINEETIASALGYAAQVVQFLAVYLGRLLPYPVTCTGSRSLIKDPISTMHGPRMFPLFSRGVDTYRFEYAVFLLNKDIEILMSERNLRAMDMRHTLPNLKNLVLTLTSGDTDDVFPLPSPGPTISLDSSTSTLVDGSSTNSLSASSLNPAWTTIGRGRQLFSPLAGFLRSHYASTIRPAVVVETPEPPEITATPTASMNEAGSAVLSESHEDAERVDDDDTRHEDMLHDKASESAIDKPGRDGLEKQLHRDAQRTSPLMPLPRVVD